MTTKVVLANVQVLTAGTRMEQDGEQRQAGAGHGRDAARSTPSRPSASRWPAPKARFSSRCATRSIRARPRRPASRRRAARGSRRPRPCGSRQAYRAAARRRSPSRRPCRRRAAADGRNHSRRQARNGSHSKLRVRVQRVSIPDGTDANPDWHGTEHRSRHPRTRVLAIATASEDMPLRAAAFIAALVVFIIVILVAAPQAQQPHQPSDAGATAARRAASAVRDARRRVTMSTCWSAARRC